MLTALCEGSILGPDVELSHLATNTAALVAVDLVDLISRAKSASIERTLRSSMQVYLISLIYCSHPFNPALLTLFHST